MADPISFDPFFGWVDATDPNNIPQDARVIGANDLLRYENLGQAVAEFTAEFGPTAILDSVRAGSRMVAAGLENGTPLEMSETGQPVTSFGNSPLVVVDGAITHTPIPTSNAAGYMQSRTATGGKVRLIYAIVQASPTANAGLALVLPQLPWANGSLTSADVHHVEYPNGNWHTSVWTGSAEVRYLGDSVAGAWNDNRPRLIAALVNEDDDSVTIRHADGSISTSAAGTVDWNKISEYGIVEIYRFTNTGADPSVPIKILAWGLSDLTGLDTLGIPTYRDIGKAITAAAPPLKAVSKYVPTPDAICSAPANITNGSINLANVTNDTANTVAVATVTGIASADGCLYVTAEAHVEVDSGTTAYWWALSGNGNGRGAQLVVRNRSWAGKSDMGWKVTGLTPGSSNTFTLQHGFSATGNTGRIKAGGGVGHLIMTAEPCSA